MIGLLSRIRNRVRRKLSQYVLRRANCLMSGTVNTTGLVPDIQNQGTIILGDNVTLGSVLEAVGLVCRPGAKISIGRGSFLNTGVRIFAADKVDIGDNAKIGNNAILCDSNFHHVHQGGKPRVSPIVIGNNVWLARNVVVLPGVTIGDHSVIAAGAVVFKDVPAKQIWAGNPAVYVKDVIASDDFVRS